MLKALESYVDDNGVGKDDLELIVSDTFPRDHIRDPSRTLARVSESIADLAGAQLITRYQVDGEDLLYIENWQRLQRVDKPNKGRHPRPDGTMEYTETVDRSKYQGVREPHETPTADDRDTDGAF